MFYGVIKEEILSSFGEGILAKLLNKISDKIILDHKKI